MAIFPIAALSARIGQGRSCDLITEPTCAVYPNLVKLSFFGDFYLYFLVQQGQLGEVKRRYSTEKSPPFTCRAGFFFAMKPHYNTRTVANESPCFPPVFPLSLYFVADFFFYLFYWFSLFHKLRQSVLWHNLLGSLGEGNELLMRTYF